MNPNNYATLEASQRLVKAGIVLETDYYWNYRDPCSPDDPCVGVCGGWELSDMKFKYGDAFIPAPSMAEVWRELPAFTHISKGKDNDYHCWVVGDKVETIFSDNPTDALIDLLIWVVKEK